MRWATAAAALLSAGPDRLLASLADLTVVPGRHAQVVPVGTGGRGPASGRAIDADTTRRAAPRRRGGPRHNGAKQPVGGAFDKGHFSPPFPVRDGRGRISPALRD